MTFYLLLSLQLSEKPMLVKKCEAKTDKEASEIFAHNFKEQDGHSMFYPDELLPYIRKEGEVTEQEREWIKELL